MNRLIFFSLALVLSISAHAQSFVSVTDKVTTRSGNKHNYESLSIYWWPNPDTPSHLPYIEKDGQWNPEYKQYDFPRLQILISNLKKYADNFTKNGDIASFDDFCKQIDIWFINRKTRMVPNFDYCQFIPGRNNEKGMPGGIIDAKNFTYVIDYIEQVNARKSIGKKRMKKMRKWFGDFSGWMIMSDNGKTEAKSSNNHGIAYDVSLYRFCQFSNQKEICKLIQDRFAEMRINTQIMTDGSQPAELKRTRAMFYSAYNLEHMLDFCEMLDRQGINYIDNEGARIKDAVLYLAKYLGRQKDFKYQEIGSWTEGENILKQQINRCKKISSDPRIQKL